ncbi:MAG: hypothetical protein J5710_08840 [Treponema sp.]|nr:hypothetical protein [Treponema sp.]
MKRLNRKFFTGLLLLLLTVPVFADYNSLGIPDSSEIRRGLKERWFEASLEEVRMNLPEIYDNAAGQKFQVRLEESDSTYMIFVAPCATINVKVYSNKGISYEQQEVYPGEAPGSWVLVRDKKTDAPLRIRWYFSVDSDIYIQFTPYGKTAVADLLIYGNYASKGSSTGIPFSSLYDISFADVMKMTSISLPWKYVTVDGDKFGSVLQMAGVIQNNLGRVMYVQNAMYDENGELVQITNGKAFDAENQDSSKLYLSSAGFVKWIADGLVEPIAGSKLKRAPLIVETVSVKDNGYQGVLSQKYNLFFSLDWIRNLAAAIVSVNNGKVYMYNEAGTDVTINPFAATISGAGTLNTVTFIEDTGYNISVLKSLLYVLAATESGNFYFGAIRETDKTITPEIKVFNDNVVFFPYFSSNGSFGCFVFMNGRQISLDDFCMIYADSYVYLTRARASNNFYPQ